MGKDFDKWNVRKMELEESTSSYYVHTREVWWCAIGLNIGFEQDGKNDLFERPVLVIKKFSRHSVLVVPLTSSIKNTLYHSVFLYKNTEYAALVSQVRMISTKRLSRILYTMDNDVFDKIRDEVRGMI
jgi:mRNA interferase MazF